MITCDKCAYCSPTSGGSLYCALTDHFVPNLGCKDGEPINKPQTNADCIRSMTDEELAEWLAKQEYKKPTFDGWLPLCNKVMGPRICHEDGCEKCWLEWLKAEVQDG